jgi:hypothetical protein
MDASEKILANSEWRKERIVCKKGGDEKAVRKKQQRKRSEQRTARKK